MRFSIIILVGASFFGPPCTRCQIMRWVYLFERRYRYAKPKLLNIRCLYIGGVAQWLQHRRYVGLWLTNFP